MSLGEWKIAGHRMEEDICHNANRQAEYDLLNFCNISKKKRHTGIFVSMVLQKALISVSFLCKHISLTSQLLLKHRQVNSGVLYVGILHGNECPSGALINLRKLYANG